MYSQLPMFQRTGASAYKPDLHNTIALCEALGNPQQSIKCIHIAGTNGKGSSSHMLASVLQQAGYKTGLYTSPHLLDFRERIKINGHPVPQDFVVTFVENWRKLFEKIRPSFFEMTVAMAFQYFSKEKVDIAVIETGLGGRLDSTNIITPILSLITNIGYDHMDILGSELLDIAREKAGIIKSEIPVVISEKQIETSGLFIETARKRHSPITFASDSVSIIALEDSTYEVNGNKENLNLSINLDLKGFYQQKNLTGVIACIMELKKYGLNISHESIKAGLANVCKTTGLMGRWQKLSEKPLVICDTGHNEDGIKEVLKQITLTPHQKLHMVFGIVKDKKPTAILSLLPKNACYYFCKANLPRSMDALELKTLAESHGLRGDTFPSVSAALESAIKHSSPDDLVFIGGSTFVVAEALQVKNS